MTSEADIRIFNALEMGRVLAIEIGHGYGYTRCTQDFTSITKAVAKAANEADLGKYNVTDIVIPPSSDRKSNGIKVTDTTHNNLFILWGMVDYVEEQLRVGINPVGKEELKRVVAKTIEDKKSGVLDKWLKEREDGGYVMLSDFIY